MYCSKSAVSPISKNKAGHSSSLGREMPSGESFLNTQINAMPAKAIWRETLLALALNS